MACDASPHNGKAADRRVAWVSDNVFWDAFAAFFPITVYKTAELEPSFVDKDENGPAVVADKTVLDSSDEEVQSDASTVVSRSNSMAGDINSDSEADGKALPRILQSSRDYDTPNVGLWSRLFRSRPAVPKTSTGKQYIFGYHPHGIIGMGALGGITNGGAHFSDMFPGIPVSLLTIANQFTLPFHRDYLLSLGLASVGRKNCQAILARGHSILIVVGGAQESLLARPGSLDLVLAKRKGFVKIAMATPGTSLVPIMAFGENDLYDQVQPDPMSKMFRFQAWLKQKFGFTVPLMYARGIFTGDFGIIPYRRPINIVVGAPIEVPYVPDPSSEEVDLYHEKYAKALQQIVEDYGPMFHKDHVGDNKACEYQDLNIIA